MQGLQRTCKKCGETRLLDEFYKKSKLPDGIDTQCVPCRKEYDHHYRHHRDEHTMKVYRERMEKQKSERLTRPIVEGRSCTKCGEYKLAVEFPKAKSFKGGLSSWCKSCYSAYLKTRWCKDASVRERAKESHQKVRFDVLRAYGGERPECACCGESEVQFLAIDHVNGRGNAHRREIGASRGLYYWLRTNKYPNGFQILCHNCNMAKGFYGKCPHQKELR